MTLIKAPKTTLIMSRAALIVLVWLSGEKLSIAM